MTYPNQQRREMLLVAALCLMFLMGCGGVTVRIDPLPKKQAVKHHTAAKHKPKRPRPTPTPAPRVIRPMQLEPTSKPTPVIKVDQVTRLNLSTPLL